jgi:hypothetical protein
MRGFHEERDALCDCQQKGTPERPESSREQEAPTQTKHLGSKKRGTAFLAGENRWSAGARPNGLVRKRKSGEGRLENDLSIAEKEQSSEERSSGV